MDGVRIISGMELVDISGELWREYTYDDGTEVHVSNPAWLYVKRGINGVSHRILSKEGVSYWISPGFKMIKWKGVPGKEFLF